MPKDVLTAVTVLELPRKARGEEGIGRVQSCIIIITIGGGGLTLCTYLEKNKINPAASAALFYAALFLWGRKHKAALVK